MIRRALHVSVMALLFPALAVGQGRDTKVQYDDGFSIGSQALERFPTTYFEILTTPAPEDAASGLVRYWGPRLDEFFRNVTDNLQFSPQEVCRYLLYPGVFVELEKLVLEGRLAPADFDTVLARTAVQEVRRGPIPAEPMRFVSPPGPRRLGIGRTAREYRYGGCVTVREDTVSVLLPGPAERALQRCVLYRTLSDFMATLIGPDLPEGVLGFVPRHDPRRPVVIYASLGEHRLNRTAQHEIAHAVVEGVSTYLRNLSVTRLLNAPADTGASKPWRPSSGGFAAITHENFAEYLAFPPGEMDAHLRAALAEMVAENRIDGLAALSVGARTLASSYIEGPARLAFLSERYGRDFPKRLLIQYYTGGLGLLDVVESLTGRSIGELEQLYRRWLRERFWDGHLATAVPDTIGAVAAPALAGVRRDGVLLTQRFRKGRQEIVLQWPPDRYGKQRHRTVVRDLDGAERLPLFSTADLRAGRVAAAARNRNRESLLLYDIDRDRRTAHGLESLGEVREVRDPRLSSDGAAVVCRVVDRSGRNALAWVDCRDGRAKLLVPWQWAEVASPSFAGDSLVLFSTTATDDRTADLACVDLRTGVCRNLTRSPGIGENEPLVIDGHLVCLADRGGILGPVEILPQGWRSLVDLPFPVERLQRGDSTLAMVAVSVRHADRPAGRALWEFPLRRLGLAAGPSPWEDVLAQAPPLDVRGVEPSEARSEVRMAGAGAAPAGDRLDSSRFLEVGGGVVAGPYAQKWRFMPLNLNFNSTNSSARGVSFMGMDTEFHDQSVILAAGQSGSFDRFGMVQYRNRAARTHWQVTGYHRSVVRRRWMPDSVQTVDRQESEQGLLLSAQYHRSLVTRLGLALAATRSSDALGTVRAVEPEPQVAEGAAPVLGLQLHGLHPASWTASLAGVPRLSMLQERSPAALEAWTLAVQGQRDRDEEFAPTLEFVRPAFRLGGSLSRDTRVWSDYRGPDSGSLLVLDVSTGVSAPGTRTFLNTAGADSTREDVPAGIERLAGSWLFLTHHRVGFVDLAFRCRGLLNDGPQALTYGLGGLYSVAGYLSGEVRSERIAWANTEARAQLWDYSTWKLPIRSLVFPAADGFLYVDSGVAAGAEPLLSYGVGLRLRLGFLAFEWRRPLRDGQRNQRGLAFVW
jgi:hypothetical protein